MDVSDSDRLEKAIRKIAPNVQESTDGSWSREPPLRVIDCVLSLNRNYDKFVVPRLDCFEKSYPGVRTVTQLHGMIANYSSPNEFVSDALDYKHDVRANILAQVVERLVRVIGDGSYEAQLERLQDWARSARPNDHTQMGIKGFGIAGYQYLRMLFGANTVKPDIYIIDFVKKAIGRNVSPIDTVHLLEEVGSKVGVKVRNIDTFIWERDARRDKDSCRVKEATTEA